MASGFQPVRYHACMEWNEVELYDALSARDRRFDGLFFVGVKTTGVYCRPVCPARLPRRSSCLFFENSAIAEKSGYRPCLKCRPELAPGLAPIDETGRTACKALELLESTSTNPENDLEIVSQRLGVSSRQLRRVVSQHWGVSPIQLVQTHRLLRAKQLIADTQLSLTEIAFAAGFKSVRRFNDAFVKHYRINPSEMRRRSGPTASNKILLRASYRPPFDWERLLKFLAKRRIDRCEHIDANVYARTIRMCEKIGWFSAKHDPARHQVLVEISDTLKESISQVLSAVNRLFDLSARPDVVAERLGKDQVLAPLVKRFPGLRVPGGVDGFELSVRAIFGQRISVAAATKLAGKFAHRFGDTIENAPHGLDCLFPDPRVLAQTEAEKIAELGMPLLKANSIRHLARLWADETFVRSTDVLGRMEQLKQCPGIGDWTAQYIAMRAWSWPDAFLAGDLGIMKALGTESISDIRERSLAWRPWRAYASMLLWESLSGT